jgi:hypothetical protein
MDVLLWFLGWLMEEEAWGGGVRAPAARCDGTTIPYGQARQCVVGQAVHFALLS